jgi:hypothetical protein
LHYSFITHAFLDDLRDFPTKSPPQYLIFGRQKSPVFVFCCFSINILPREASGEVVANERSHEAQTGMGGTAHLLGRATRAHLALKRRLISVFLCMPLSQNKTYAIFFLDFSEAAAE